MRLKLSLQAVADAVGVSKEAVRLWETGRTIRGRNLLRLCRLLGLSPTEVMEGRDGELEALVTAADAAAEVREMLEQVRRLEARLSLLLQRLEE